MAVTLKSETEVLLRERAAREGTDISAITDALIHAGLEWETRDREEAAASLRRALAESDTGKVRLFAEVAAEMRTKYHLPTSLRRGTFPGTNDSRPAMNCIGQR